MGEEAGGSRQGRGAAGRDGRMRGGCQQDQRGGGQKWVHWTRAHDRGLKWMHWVCACAECVGLAVDVSVHDIQLAMADMVTLDVGPCRMREPHRTVHGAWCTGRDAARTIAVLLVDSDSGRSNVRQYTALDPIAAVKAVGLVVYDRHSGDTVLGSIPGLASFGHHRECCTRSAHTVRSFGCRQILGPFFLAPFDKFLVP